LPLHKTWRCRKCGKALVYVQGLLG
jgi:phage FluMu protein Com